jgi:hypothetical protein
VHTGLFQQNRSFDSVWETELGPTQGPWHKIFSNNSNATIGSYEIKKHSVSATIRSNTTSFTFTVVYTGKHFGCQNSFADLVGDSALCSGDDCTACLIWG